MKVVNVHSFINCHALALKVCQLMKQSVTVCACKKGTWLTQCTQQSSSGSTKPGTYKMINAKATRPNSLFYSLGQRYVTGKNVFEDGARFFLEFLYDRIH